MNCIKIGELNINFLDQDLEFRPFEKVQIIIRRLNCLLGLIEKFYQDKLPLYVSKLKSEFEIQLQHDIHEDNIINDIIREMKHLSKFPDLAKKLMNYYLQVLQIPKGKDWIKDMVKVTNRNELLSLLLPRYYNLLALTKTIEREDAINLYKRCETKFLKDRQEKREFEGVEAKFKSVAQPTQFPSPWVMLIGLLPNGKYFYRNDNCLWVDVLTDLPDNELKYMICCYGDYQYAKNHNGDSVILTMEHTIAQGDPYCSRVLHDTRVDWDLRHPPKEFWDNLRD